MYQIIETFSEVFQRLKLIDSKQVKAGVAYVASPADHIGRQSRPFRRSLGFSLGGLLKGRPDLEVFQEIKQFPYFSQRKSCPVLLGVIKKKTVPKDAISLS